MKPAITLSFFFLSKAIALSQHSNIDVNKEEAQYVKYLTRLYVA